MDLLTPLFVSRIVIKESVLFHLIAHYLLLVMESKEQILEKAYQYIHWLTTPNKAFSNMAVCPFLEPEIKKEQLYIDLWYPAQQAFMDKMEEFHQSHKSSALFICPPNDTIDWEQVNRKSIQKTLNNKLKEYPLFSEFKCIVLSPWEDFTAGGVATRERSPYFMINIGNAKHFAKSHTQLQKSRYFANFTDDEKKVLKVK